MSGSHYERESSRATLRIGLAIAAGLVFLGETWTLANQLQDPFYHAASPFLLKLIRPTPGMLVGLYLIGVSGLVVFARNRHPIKGGSLALGCMALVCQWGGEIFGSVSHNFFYPGGLLFGWLCGLAVAHELRRRGHIEAQAPAFADAVAEAGTVGVLAALYVGSGVSKLISSRLGWANANGLRAVLLAQEGFLHIPWIDAYRRFVIESPHVTQALAFGTLVIELGGFVLLINRPLRIFWGFLILGLHLNIMILVHIPYLEPMVLVPLFTLPWPWFRRLLTRRATRTGRSGETALE